MVTTVPIFTSAIAYNQPGPQVGLKIQPASDSSGAYVPVVALDPEAEITIGSVSQEGIWTVGLSAGSATIGTVLAPLVTPRPATVSTIAVGGTAVILVTGPINGGYITNPANAAAQGIEVAENLYLDPIGTPGSTDAAANGTTILLAPGQNFSVPPLASGVSLKANAATNGHNITIVIW